MHSENRKSALKKNKTTCSDLKAADQEMDVALAVMCILALLIKILKCTGDAVNVGRA